MAFIKRFWLGGFMIICVLLSTLKGGAQAGYVNTATQTGLTSQGSYQSDTETVNMLNGDNQVRLPLLHIPGRAGFDLDLTLLSDSKTYSVVGESTTFQFGQPQIHPPGFVAYPFVYNSGESIGPLQFAGGILSIPGLTYYEQDYDDPIGDSYTITACYQGLIYTDSTGAQHGFPAVIDCQGSYPGSHASRAVVASSDPAGDSVVLDGTDPTNVIVTEKSGHQAHFALQAISGFPASGVTNAQGLATSINDTDGNTIKFTESSVFDRASNTTQTTVNIVDSIGRQVSITPSGINYTDSNGTPQTILVSTAPAASGSTQYLSIAGCQTTETGGSQDYPTLPPQSFGSSQSKYTFTFPDGGGAGLMYGLTYDSLGEVIRVDYPGGGYTRYDYQPLTGRYITDGWQCQADLREVYHKYTCANSHGVCTQEQITTYTPSGVDVANQFMDVTDPSGNRRRYEFSVLSSNNINDEGGVREINRSTYQGQSSRLSVIHTDYSLDSSQGGTPYIVTCSLPIAVTTTLGSATSHTETDYDAVPSSLVMRSTNECGQLNTSIDNPIAYREYGYDGALIRTTTKAWTPYTAAHVWDRIASSTTTDAVNGNVSSTTYKRNSNGDLTSIQRSGTGVQTLITSYSPLDAYGRPTQITDPYGAVTTLSYDDNWANLACAPATNSGAYLTTTTNALGQVTTSSFDSCTGAPASVINPNGGVTTTSYDAAGRHIFTQYPDSGTTTISYNGDSIPLTATTTVAATPDPSIVSKVQYDGLGRASIDTLPSGATTEVDYDGVGNVSSEENPHVTSISSPTDGTTRYSYDALNCKVATIFPDATTESWAYTANVTTYSDANGNQWQRTDDSLGRLTKMLETDPQTGTLSLESDYLYDALGDVTQVDQWGGPRGGLGDRQRLFKYDGLARLIKATQPESGTIVYSYLSGASLCSRDEKSICSTTDARGVITSFSYDALGRLTRKAYSNDPSNTSEVDYRYDSPQPGWTFPDQIAPSWVGVTQSNLSGRISSETNGNATMVFGYDAAGRITLKSVCTPLTCGVGDHFDLHYKYNLAGGTTFSDIGLDALKNATTPKAGFYYGGLMMGYNHALELITGTADIVDATHPASIVSGLQYSPLGGVTSLQFGSVYGEGDQYTSRGWLLQRYGNDVTNGLQRTGTLSHDAVGNVTKLVDSYLGTTMYSYDPLNRLTSFSNPYAGVTYGFDAWGNMTTHTQTVGTGYSFSLSYNSKNQTTQAGSTNGGLSYDASGNVLTDGLNSYGYDGEGRLLSLNNSTTYLYGPDGTRVATTQSGGVTAEYLYDLNNTLVTTLGADGKMVRGSLYGGNMHLADYTVGTGAGGGHTEFRFMDEVNSLAIKVDQDGNLLENCYENPFGESLNCNGPNSNSIAADFTETHFTDKKRDAESGLDYSGSRYYGSTVGRFTTPDPGWFLQSRPGNPQTWNQYAYGLNNPLVNTDPTGMDCITDNQDGTVSANGGDCANENDVAANHEFYVNCDNCTSGATGAQLDTATGGLYLTDANGNGLANTTVQGFADAQGVATSVNVDNVGAGMVFTSGFGVSGAFEVTRYTNLPMIPGLIISNPNAPSTPGRSFLGTLKGIFGCWATDDPDFHVGPTHPEPKASTDSVPNKNSDLSVSSRRGNKMSPNVGNPEAAEGASGAADAAGMFNDINNCLGK